MKYMKILFVYIQMAHQKMWHYCRVIVHMAYQKIQSNYGLSAYI